MLYADWIHGSEDFSAAREVRRKVFIEEQQIPEDVEYDASDAMAWHLVVLDDDTPIGAGRVYLENNDYHIGRICVLPEQRHFGIGDAIVRLLLERALTAGAKIVYLSAQTYIKDAYKKFGFEESGEPYSICGHEHINMFVKAENALFPSPCNGNCADCGGDCDGGCDGGCDGECSDCSGEA